MREKEEIEDDGCSVVYAKLLEQKDIYERDDSFCSFCVSQAVNNFRREKRKARAARLNRFFVSN